VAPPSLLSPEIPEGTRKLGHQRAMGPNMYQRFILALTLLTVIAFAPLLSACNTTAGVGQDISATGKALENTAKKNTP
jgi:predicted small secreted protein